MSTKFALLGLLNIRKMSAYDLAKFAKDAIGYFWNESYSNVHRTLKILVDEKQIEKLPEQGTRNKTIFEITELGRQTLSDWLSNHEHSIIYRDELLLKLFVSKPQDYPALVQDLKALLEESLDQRKTYSDLQASLASKPDTLSYDLVLDYGLMENEVRIAWLENTIQKMEEAL